MKYFQLALALLCSLNCFAAGDALNDKAANQISIMTWNIKMLPRGGVFLHHHPVIRARLIPEKILAVSPDVVVFEEAFDGKAIRILKKKLKGIYPFYAGIKNRKVISYKRAGGVLMFSKYPVKEIESIRYTRCKGIDCIGNKGALLVTVSHPLKQFQLLGTHMQAGGGGDLKQSQFAEAAELLKRNLCEGVPQFATGDFNTRKTDSILYPRLLNSLQMEDGEICTDLKYTSDHLLNDMQNYNPQRRNIVDYVFFRANGIKPFAVSRSVMEIEQRWSKKHKDLSDHNAVIMRMKL